MTTHHCPYCGNDVKPIKLRGGGNGFSCVYCGQTLLEEQLVPVEFDPDERPVESPRASKETDAERDVKIDQRLRDKDRAGLL